VAHGDAVTAPITAERLAEIEARANAATPGEWVADHEFGFVAPRGACAPGWRGGEGVRPAYRFAWPGHRTGHGRQQPTQSARCHATAVECAVRGGSVVQVTTARTVPHAGPAASAPRPTPHRRRRGRRLRASA
jgi:hypothetical protein